MCKKLTSITFVKLIKQSHRPKLVTIYFLLPVFFMLPIIAYLAFITCRPPHDCFKCFNRHPNLRYSIFQFDRFERQLQHEQKVGKRVANYLDNLILEYEVATQRASKQRLSNDLMNTKIKFSDDRPEHEQLREYEQH